MAQQEQRQAGVDTPIGRLILHLRGGRLTAIDLPGDGEQSAPDLERNHPARRALEDYFTSAAPLAGVTIELYGTDYQRRVWQALQAIPLGQTRTYGELARDLKTSARAVGNACRQNPLPLFVPCHRVVAADGSGGFMGARDGRPLQIKHWLLAHERAV